MQPVIEIKGLNFAYNSHRVLKNVDLTVARGDFLAIVGPNGGGKTTLLKCILGLHRPIAGSVQVFGGPPSRALGRVGYVPQHTEIKKGFPLTVLDAVLMGLATSRFRGFLHSGRQRDMAMAALTRVGAADYAGSRMDALSGGQRQRVLVARALAPGPELLIFDEPTSNIDPQGKFCFYELLSDLGREMTIVVVSHDVSIIASKVTAVACVNAQLIYNPEPELTPEMLTLLYGAHGHTCPMGAYLENFPGTLAPPRLTDHD